MIRIIAEKNEKGQLFESLLKMILSKQGYGNIESNIHSTGTEIDIEATDNVTGSKIRVEAKAHEKPIDSPELQKFLLTANNDLMKKKIAYAVFWSLSGINSTAKNYFETELVSEFKNQITIKGNKEFQQILVDIGLIGNESSIDNNIAGIVKKNLLGRDLVFYQNQWYFIQYCSETQESTHFFVLDNFGKPVEDIIAKSIRKSSSDLEKLNLILLLTKNHVLEFLMYHESASMKEIIEGIKETQIDIQSVLEELLDQQLIDIEKSEEPKYSISKGLDAFLKISREFLKNRKMVLMKSPYLSLATNYEISSYIENRFHLKFSDEIRKVVLRMVLVSPSALEYSLFKDTKSIENQLQQFDQKIPDNLRKINYQHFMTQMCLSVLYDLRNGQSLGLQKTRGVLLDIKLKMSTLDELYFKIDAKSPLMIMKLQGSAKEGQALSAVNPETFLETSMIFYNMGEIIRAIKEIDDALKAFKNEGEWLAAAYINKGMYLEQIGKTNESFSCLKNATKLFPDKKEGWLNLGNVFLRKKKLTAAKDAFNKALKLDENYVHAKYGLARTFILQKKRERMF